MGRTDEPCKPAGFGRGEGQETKKCRSSEEISVSADTFLTSRVRHSLQQKSRSAAKSQNRYNRSSVAQILGSPCATSESYQWETARIWHGPEDVIRATRIKAATNEVCGQTASHNSQLTEWLSVTTQDKTATTCTEEVYFQHFCTIKVCWVKSRRRNTAFCGTCVCRPSTIMGRTGEPCKPAGFGREECQETKKCRSVEEISVSTDGSMISRIKHSV